VPFRQLSYGDICDSCPIDYDEDGDGDIDGVDLAAFVTAIGSSIN